MSYSLRGAKLAFISKFHKTMLPLFDKSTKMSSAGAVTIKEKIS